MENWTHTFLSHQRVCLFVCVCQHVFTAALFNQNVKPIIKGKETEKLISTPLPRFPVKAGIFTLPYLPSGKSLLPPTENENKQYNPIMAECESCGREILQVWFGENLFWHYHHLRLGKCSFCVLCVCVCAESCPQTATHTHTCGKAKHGRKFT